MGTDTDPCDLHLDLLMKPQGPGVCVLPDARGTWVGDREEEVHVRPRLCHLSGTVKLVVEVWDPLQKMPPGVTSGSFGEGGLQGEGKERRKLKRKDR